MKYAHQPGSKAQNKMSDDNDPPSSTETAYVLSGYHIFNKFLPSTITIRIIDLLSWKHEK